MGSGKAEFSFLNNGGEMGQLISDIDWSQNPLGNPGHWPQSLYTTLSIILNSKFPMFLFWGPELICFYNDAYRPSLGNNGKHPAAMGQKAIDCWPESWHIIKPLIDKVLATGEATWSEDQLIPIYRNGRIEDVYWTFSYSAVNDESGMPGGVFVTCAETTGRLKSLQEISESKTKLEFALTAAELGTWELFPKTNKIAINKRLKTWFGLLEDEQFDLSFAINVIDPAEREKVTAAIQWAMQYESGGVYNIDYKIINPLNKEERYVRAKGKALFNENKEAYRFNGILMDVSQEVKARQVLIESEDNFRRLVEQAPLAICVVKEPDNTITIINDRMLKLLGKEINELISKPFFDCLPEAKHKGLEKILTQVYATGENYFSNEMPLNVIYKGLSSILYINLVCEALKDREGKMEGVMIVATDVTEQVNAKIKILDAEERARLAADAVDLGTFDLNLLTSELIASARVSNIFGFKENVSRKEMLAQVHPDDKQVQIDAHKKAVEEGFLFYELRIIWKDNTVHWIRAEGKTYYDELHKPIRLLGTILDITNQREAEEDLLKTNQRLAIALEVGQLGSYELNIETGFVNASEQFRKNFGIEKAMPLTQDVILNKIMPGQRERVMEAVESAIKNNTVYNEEYQIKWPDNTLHWIKSSAKARYNKNLKPLMFIGVTADITEHKQLQQQKDDFIGIASHELKTPVTTIKAYSQLLEEILVAKGLKREAAMVTKMGTQINRLTNLIGDLLDVTKINSGKLQLNNTRFDFNDLVNDIVEDIQNTIPKVTIVQKLAPAGFVYADKERIVQVITNLITNAVKYSPNKSNIIIHVTKEETEIVLCVEDFGVGISKAHQEKVFEQFYRVSGDIQHTFPGLGLGLYISSEIIKRVGGRIWVNSIEGEGSTFCFSLPTIN